MGLGAEFFNILKDTVKLTDAVERLNSSVTALTSDVRNIDKRMVRLETMVEIAEKQQQRLNTSK
ncbi:MAG: hypothetical protein COB35_13235 [Gammaproteobacteria bacterium]|nr:MAG: hypothetical protein COB35_13235 [Gammaproteobacteria bacterium]